MELFKVPHWFLRSSTWAILLVYAVLLLPRPGVTDRGDINHDNNERSLTNEQEDDGIEFESHTNNDLIDENERGIHNEQMLDILPVVTTPPTNDPLLEEPPRLAPPVKLDLQETDESLNIGESSNDHVTVHDQDILNQQDHMTAHENDDIIPSAQVDEIVTPPLDDRGTVSDNILPDTPPSNSDGIQTDSDVAMAQSHDQGVAHVEEIKDSKVDVDSDVHTNEEEAAKKTAEEDGQLLPPESREEASHDETVANAEQEGESLPQAAPRDCGELDDHCHETDTVSETTDKASDGETEEGKDEEDDVLTFQEFKQKMIEQGAGQQRVSDELNSLHLSPKNQNKNFASLDCGAKVIETNPGAQNPSSILDENRDKYMINSCSSKIWFIIQLCELVSVRSLEIASFELFSSTPQSFNVYCAERYPTDNWFQLGTFLARNERMIQSFPIITDENVYANYIKVEMVSHYGDERYCPLSLFRVLGASMIEVFEESEQNVHSAGGGGPTQASLVLPPSEGVGEDDIFWELPDGNDEEKNETLLHRAKDAVLRVINKINDFIHPDEDDQDQDGHSSSTNVTNATNASAIVNGDASEGCGLGDGGCVKGEDETREPEDSNGSIDRKEESPDELKTSDEDTAVRGQSVDEVDVHHHGNSVEESRPIPTSPDVEQSLHQIDEGSTASSRVHTPPVEDDSIAVGSQGAEVNEELSNGASGDKGSVSFEEEVTNEETEVKFEQNDKQEETVPVISPSPPHTVTDSPPPDNTAGESHDTTVTTQPNSDQQGTSVTEITPELSPSSDKTDSNETEQPETIPATTGSTQEEETTGGVSVDSNSQDHLKIEPSSTNTVTELKSEAEKEIDTDSIVPVSHSPLGPVSLPSSTVPGENKATPPQDDNLSLGPPIPVSSDKPLNEVPTHNTDGFKAASTLPSASISQPYADVSEPSTINQDAQNSVSTENDQTSDYSNEQPDLSGLTADGSLLIPAQNTTGSHINVSKVINTSLPSDEGHMDGRDSGGEEFKTSSLEFGGSNETYNGQSTHPHIPSAAVANSSVESGTASDHTEGWNVANLSENNDTTNTTNLSMNTIDPEDARQEALSTQQNVSVGVNNSNKTNASLSASSEGGSGAPSHGVNGNGGAHYLGSLPPREREKSVFLRLSNNIKELEVNMSIFSSYLDQISTSLKRNKNRTDEAMRALDKKINSLNESLSMLKDEASVHLHSLLEINQELQQLTSAMADLTGGLDSLSHDISSQQNLLAIINMMAIVTLSLFLCVWYSCSQYKVHRELEQLKDLIVKSETLSSGRTSTNVSLSSSVTGQVLRNSHVRSSSASELSDLKSVRGIGELSQSHLRGFDSIIGGVAHGCHGNDVGMNGLSSHSLSSLDDRRETGNEMWKVIDGRRKKKTKSKQKT